MYNSNPNNLSNQTIDGLQRASAQISTSGTVAGVAALGGAVAASLVPGIGTGVAAVVVGAGTINAAYTLAKRQNIQQAIHKLKPIANAQKQLKFEGYYQDGIVDGILGPETEKAIKKFQGKKNLEQTGELDQQTKIALRLD